MIAWPEGGRDPQNGPKIGPYAEKISPGGRQETWRPLDSSVGGGSWFHRNRSSKRLWGLRTDHPSPQVEAALFEYGGPRSPGNRAIQPGLKDDCLCSVTRHDNPVPWVKSMLGGCIGSKGVWIQDKNPFPSELQADDDREQDPFWSAIRSLSDRIPAFFRLFRDFGDASHVGASTTGRNPFSQNL